MVVRVYLRYVYVSAALIHCCPPRRYCDRDVPMCRDEIIETMDDTIRGHGAMEAMEAMDDG